MATVTTDACTAWLEYRESAIQGEAVKIKQNANRARGSINGRAAWGFYRHCADCNAPAEMPKCKPHKKVFEPTAEGRKYIPLIYQMAIDGKSLRVIGAWLESKGVFTSSGKRWTEANIGADIIKNPIYYGHRRNGGQLETEALVSYSVWQQANAALKSRVKLGRSPAKGEKALLSAVCGNPGCDASGIHPSPMYRTGAEPWQKYRCNGRGLQPFGCGNVILVAELDSRVIETMEADHINWHVHRDFIPGDDRSDEIGKLRERGAESMKQGDYAAATDCMQQAEKLEGLPRIAPHWEDSYTCHECGSAKDVAACVVKGHGILTEGEYFAGLNTEGRKRELAESWIVSAYRQPDGLILVSIIRKTA